MVTAWRTPLHPPRLSVSTTFFHILLPSRLTWSLLWWSGFAEYSSIKTLKPSSYLIVYKSPFPSLEYVSWKRPTSNILFLKQKLGNKKWKLKRRWMEVKILTSLQTKSHWRTWCCPWARFTNMSTGIDWMHSWFQTFFAFLEYSLCSWDFILSAISAW